MPGDRGMLGNMPGYLADPECFGVKLVSLIPGNHPPLHSSHLGLVLLFESEHGCPVALLDAAEIKLEAEAPELARNGDAHKIRSLVI